jgi:hypothetical protein
MTRGIPQLDLAERGRGDAAERHRADLERVDRLDDFLARRLHGLG